MNIQINTQINAKSDYMIPSIQDYWGILISCSYTGWYKESCKEALKNIKNTKIPLQQRKKKAFDALIEHMSKFTDEDPTRDGKIEEWNKLFLKKKKNIAIKN